MTKHRLFAITALVAAMLASHAQVSVRAETSDLGCREATSTIRQMHENLRFPPSFSQSNATKRGGEFDANQIFEALPHLRMREGFTLDYVYHQDGMGGYPLLYARPLDQRPYLNEAEYKAAPEQPDYRSFLIPQDSAAGYFDYAVFTTTANQFYLDWHANYNDWRVLCDSADIEDVIRSVAERSPSRPMTPAQQQAARAIPDPGPASELGDKTATVTMLVFTKWGGFYRRTLTFSRADHATLDERDQPLVEYDCGVAF